MAKKTTTVSSGWSVKSSSSQKGVNVYTKGNQVIYARAGYTPPAVSADAKAAIKTATSSGGGGSKKSSTQVVATIQQQPDIDWNKVSSGQIAAAGYKNLTEYKTAYESGTAQHPDTIQKVAQTSTGAGIYSTPDKPLIKVEATPTGTNINTLTTYTNIGGQELKGTYDISTSTFTTESGQKISTSKVYTDDERNATIELAKKIEIENAKKASTDFLLSQKPVISNEVDLSTKKLTSKDLLGQISGQENINADIIKQKEQDTTRLSPLEFVGELNPLSFITSGAQQVPAALESAGKVYDIKTKEGFFQQGTTVGDILSLGAKGAYGVASIPGQTIDVASDIIFGKGSETDKYIESLGKTVAEPVKTIGKSVVSSISKTTGAEKVILSKSIIGGMDIASGSAAALIEIPSYIVGKASEKKAKAFLTITPSTQEQRQSIESGVEQAGRIVGGAAPMLIPGVGGAVYGAAMTISGTPEQATRSIITGGLVGAAGRTFDIGAKTIVSKTGNIPVISNVASLTSYVAPKVDQFYDIYQLGTTGLGSVQAASSGDILTARALEKELITGLGGAKVGVKAGEKLFDITAGTGLYSQAATSTKVDVPGRESYSLAKQLLSDPTVDVLTVQKSYKSIDTLKPREPGSIADISYGKAGVFGTIKESGSKYGDVGKYFIEKTGPENIKLGKLEVPFTKAVDALLHPSQTTIYELPSIRTVAKDISPELKGSILGQLEAQGKVDVKTQSKYLSLVQKQADISGQPIAAISPKILTGKGASNLELETFMIYPTGVKAEKISKPQLVGFETYTRTPIIRETGKVSGSSIPSIFTKNIVESFKKQDIALNKEMIIANRKLAQIQGFEKQSAISYDVQQHGKVHIENVYKNLLSQQKVDVSLKDYSKAELKWAAYLHDVTKVRAEDIGRIEHGKGAAELARTGRINVPLEVDGQKIMFEQLPIEKQKSIIRAVETHTTIKPVSSILSKTGTTIKGLTEGLTGSPLQKALANADRLDFRRFGIEPEKAQIFGISQKIKSDIPVSKDIYKPIIDTSYKYKAPIEYNKISAYKQIDYTKPTDYIKVPTYKPQYYPKKDIYKLDYKQTEYIKPIEYKPIDYTKPTEYKNVDYIKTPDYIPIDYIKQPPYKPIDYIKPIKYTPIEYKSRSKYAPFDYRQKEKVELFKYNNINSGFGEQKSETYDVYVRKGKEPETGKKRKVLEVLVEKGLPYNAAVNRGLEIASTYAQRTAFLKKSRERANVPDELINKQLMGQFRSLAPRSKIKAPRALTFVEKSKFAINTQQEKEGITYKAAKLAKERKSGFWSMRI